MVAWVGSVDGSARHPARCCDILGVLDGGSCAPQRPTDIPLVEQRNHDDPADTCRKRLVSPVGATQGTTLPHASVGDEHTRVNRAVLFAPQEWDPHYEAKRSEPGPQSLYHRGHVP